MTIEFDLTEKKLRKELAEANEEIAKLKEVVVWVKNYLYATSFKDELHALRVLESKLKQVKV